MTQHKSLKTLKTIAILALVAVTLAPSASALGYVTLGNAGNTTGIRASVDGVVYFNCGRGNQYGNPSMDLALLGGSDNLADASFYGTAGAVPSACRSIGAAAPIHAGI